jgi:arabinose-5-phosphate isomerase
MTLDFRRQALQVLQIEAAAVTRLASYIDENFNLACQMMYDCKGRVIVIGMGKSGHIANKIAATLASTGTPSFFVHPAEASHGDLGMITQEDVVLAISNSGETAEVLTIVPVLKRRGIPMIAMTGRPSSTLATLADVHLSVIVEQEACPLGLAPTASTTATLAMGDAIAVALLDVRGFSADDFALSHPGGSLGRRLLLRLEDLMHSGDELPLVHQQVSLKEALLEISRKGLGMTAVADDNGKLVGLFTDGDLRRVLDQQVNLHTATIASLMTPNCITAKASMLAAEALQVMEQRKINGLIVVNEQQEPVGALNMHDLLKAGVL